MVTVINYLTRIHFGPGAVKEIPNLLQQHGIRRPLLVTDNNLIQAGLSDRVPATLAAVFTDVPSNPTESSVEAGTIRYREAECDGIIALGGGSPVDCAKAISLMVTHPLPLEQYAAIRGGMERIRADKPPVIAVPTTSGTGSEVGRAALISFSSGEKLGLISPHMIPTEAVCDPELTLGLPPLLTAATGMDAISHCVETFCSNKTNPVADAIAIDGLVRAFRSLRAVVASGDDLKMRTEMMMASLQGGLTFQKGLGMIHSLSHPLGALKDKSLHHGTLNAIFLPHVLRFNEPACPERMAAMADAIAVPPHALSESFVKLSVDIGLPVALSELGVSPDDLSGIAQAAMNDHSTPSNPRAMTLSDCECVLRESL